MSIHEMNDDFLDRMFLLQERLEKDDRQGNKIHKRRGTHFVRYWYFPNEDLFIVGKCESMGKVVNTWSKETTFLLSSEPPRKSNSKPKGKR